MRDGACLAPLCAGAVAAELPDGRWLVALGIEGAMRPLHPEQPESVAFERPPADLVLAMDLSGSTASGSEVAGAAVEMAVERLRDDDTLAIVGFSDAAEVLLEPTPMGPYTVERVASVLSATDRLPALRDTLGEVRQLLPWLDPCAEAPDALVAELEVCAAVEGGGPHPCGDGWTRLEGDVLDGLLDELTWWVDLAEADETERLAAQLQPMACGGTDVPLGLELAVDLAPDGTTERASRVVLISDMGGAAEAAEVVEDAAARWVGTTLLGITPAVDREAAHALARAPGALFLDASDPAEALGTWHARFDLLVAPRAWSLRPVGLERHDVEEVFGATDAEGLGANAVFASVGHGALGAIVSPPTHSGATPFLRLVYELPDGAHALRIPVRPPLGLVEAPFASADSVPALDLAARRHLHAHRDAPDGAVDDVRELLAHPLVADEAFPWLRQVTGDEAPEATP